MIRRSFLGPTASFLFALLTASACTVIVHDAPATNVDLGEARDAVPPGLTRSAPLRCENNDELRVEGLYITGQGPGAYAVGNCDLWIVGSVIDVQGVAIRVDGNGDVYVRDSEVRGSDAAYVINGNGDIHVAGSTLTGRREIVGNGELVDEGGNTFN